MKVLISCVNSPQSLIGYDTDSKDIFWSVPSTQFKACGASYFHADLLISSDDYVIYFSREGGRVLKIEGPYQPLAHSIHPVNEEMFGVIDTGHSALRVYKPDFSAHAMISPLAGWPQVPQDAIHLNDLLLQRREYLRAVLIIVHGDRSKTKVPLKIGAVVATDLF